MEKTGFIKLICPKCNHHQVTYSKASCKIKCDKCNQELTRTSGGKARLRAKVSEVLR